MADSEVLKRLEDVPFRIQTGSLKERRLVLKEIQDILATEGITEPVVKFICHHLATTLHNYRDSTSQFYVNQLITYLAGSYKEWTLANFLPVLLKLSKQLKGYSASEYTCRASLHVLRWSTLLIEGALKTPAENVDYNILVLVQANLLAAVTVYGNQNSNEKAYSMLHRAWGVPGCDEEACARALLKLPARADAVVPLPAGVVASVPVSAGAVTAVALAALCRHVAGTPAEAIVLKHKDEILSIFTASLISVKERPHAAHVAACAPLLALPGAARALLPSLHKALLRSPETSLEAVGVAAALLASDDADTHGLLLGIGKSFIGSLHCADAWTRGAARAALGALAARAPLQLARELLDHVFKVYADLTSSEDKIAVLQGATDLLAAGPAERSALADAAGAALARLLEGESHERTLSAAADALAAWARATDAPLHPDVLEQLKKQLASAKTGAGVRLPYLRLLATAAPPAPAAPLLAAVERARAQPLQQASVSEGVCAMHALVRADAARALPAAQPAAWAALAHPQRHVLLHDRVLAAATEEVLEQVVLLCKSVLDNYQIVADDINSPLYRAFVLTLLSHMRPVRAVAIKNVKELLAKPDRAKMARNLVSKLNEVLEEKQTAKIKEKTPPEEKGSDLTGKAILEGIHGITAYREYAVEDREAIAIEALRCCHHPLVSRHNPRAWPQLLGYQRIQPRRLLALHAARLNQLYICGFTPGEMQCGIAASLLAGHPELTAPRALERVLDALRDPALLAVTRDEYFTYLTPDQELYDKSVLPGSDDHREQNLRRESRAYSYREQLDELQLRRELDEEARRQGRTKQTPLTPKQKEAVKVQLAKESAIRQKLTALAKRVEEAVGLTDALRRGAADALRGAASPLLGALLAALQSPLAAPHAAPLYRRLRHELLPHPLADTVARLTIRLHEPQCDLEPGWPEGSLAAAAARVVALLHAATAARPDQPEPRCSRFSPAGFCYIFPLLKLALTNNAASERTLQLGVQLVALHAAPAEPRPPPPAAARPPLDQMLQLLLDQIGARTGRVQSASMAALLEVAAFVGAHQPTDAEVTEGDEADPDTAAEVQCLLEGLLSESEVVRDAALRALLAGRRALPALLAHAPLALTITQRLYVARFDVNEDNRALATELWAALPGLEAVLARGALPALLLRDTQLAAEPLQRAAAAALGARAPPPADALLQDVQDLYREKLPMIPAKLDQFGHVVSPAVDAWGARRGAALAMRALAPALSPAAAPFASRFFVAEGLADRAEPVRAEMLNAAMAVVELHGKETIGSQLPVFEEFLDKAPKSGGYDSVRQCVVLLVGSLARHLEPGDARVRPIALRLVAALSTPSQQVQEAVSNCLPPLVASPALQDEVPAIVAKLMKQLLTAEKYGDRKGAAYGLAGVVKGLGILALKQLDIMSKLTEAIQEKKNYKYREGALFAFEMLCLKLGRLFEPYVVHVLPHLLLCFGDQSQYVRTAADDTAKLIMSKLSAHGVKLVLPALLHALEDDNWRTKTGSVELLGAMAYCAPKQLSSCLPSIVPKLIEVLSDSHTRVQEAGGDALRVIGSVIRNPEIQAIVPVLLSAVQDPSHKTSACLQTLLDTKFVHFIDAPSLALIMPVVERAFMDRSTDTRKMAAQIIGNMYSLTDQKDLLPYLPHIMPGLKASLLDPVPEVRSVSARALGAMVKGMGEASFEELLPWLMSTLTSESSSVDRSGAAQGLSEVVAGLGVHQLHKLMPDIIATAERTDIQPHVKDGYIMMFIYMPGAFTDEFLPYIGHIISPILQALADENEFVRETALKAGQRIVTLYADSAITLLLPELEKGLFDDNWRIRHASVQLLGDLLYRISGVSGKMSTETASEDDNFGTEQSHGAILRALGAERRDRVLAGLYMGRSDVALMVRQAALHVWKVVVTNTPKTLREILPTLFGLLLGCLASTSYDKRQVAARTLGDLVRKLGERVLPEIVPILERGLRSERADQRQGVCIGLGEIIASTSRDTVLTFADGLVPTVRTALCDPLPEVRMAAARTFDSLHATIGTKALDDILPKMLLGLRDPDPAVAEATLDGLRQVMAIKSRAVLPYLVPVLTSGTVDTRALSALAAAAGDALARHLHRVLPALLAALAAARDTRDEARELEQCRDALLPVTDDAGVRSILDALLEAARSGPPDDSRRRAAAVLLCAFVSHSRADLSSYVPSLLRGLMLLMAWDDRDVLQAAWDALAVLTRSLDAERQIQHVGDVRQAVRFAASDLKGDLMPGFCLPKGIAPLLPLFRESILNGLPEDKEASALMLSELIRLTSPAALQPSVIHITGPLIRILGDRFNSGVKAAVLETLALLLENVGVMLKQFLPQLQTTFLKALTDPSRPVRMRAGLALAQLVRIHARADPLFLDLHAGIKNSDDPAVRETMLQALRSLLTVGGHRMSEPLALSVLTTLTGAPLLAHPEEAVRGAVGGCLGALLHALPPPHRAAALQHHVLAPPPPPAHDHEWLAQHARSAALFVALKETPQDVYADNNEEKIDKALLAHLAADRIPIVCNGIRGIGYLIRYLLKNERPIPPNIVSQFMRSMNHSSNEVKQLMARACTLLGREGALCAPDGGPGGARAELLRAMLPALVNGTKEKNSYVRANSELALRAVLRLPGDDAFHQQCVALLEVGAREALADVVTRVLRRAPTAAEARDEDLDCTLLT